MYNYQTTILSDAYKLETAVCCKVEWNAVISVVDLSSSVDYFF